MKTENVRLIKFTNGEEILVEQIEGNDTSDPVVFQNPIRVLVIPLQGQGQRMTIGFSDWLPYAETKDVKFSISKIHILAILKPKKELLEQYKGIWEPSNLVVPKSPGLILPT